MARNSDDNLIVKLIGVLLFLAFLPIALVVFGVFGLVREWSRESERKRRVRELIAKRANEILNFAPLKPPAPPSCEYCGAECASGVGRCGVCGAAIRPPQANAPDEVGTIHEAAAQLESEGVSLSTPSVTVWKMTGYAALPACVLIYFATTSASRVLSSLFESRIEHASSYSAQTTYAPPPSPPVVAATEAPPVPATFEEAFPASPPREKIRTAWSVPAAVAALVGPLAHPNTAPSNSADCIIGSGKTRVLQSCRYEVAKVSAHEVVFTRKNRETWSWQIEASLIQPTDLGPPDAVKLIREDADRGLYRVDQGPLSPAWVFAPKKADGYMIIESTPFLRLERESAIREQWTAALLAQHKSVASAK